jgi:stage III sporulation protein SpoIIIAA
MRGKFRSNGPDTSIYAVSQITWEDLAAAEAAVGDFGGDNRAGVQGTLHRISAIRNRKGTIIGLTCRVGRAVTGHIDMIRDILDSACLLWCIKMSSAVCALQLSCSSTCWVM